MLLANRRLWKSSTEVVNRCHYRVHLLPRFGDLELAEISRRDVSRWFANLHAKPSAANRSLTLLSLIMRQAEFFGHRHADSNPCSGLRRYQCPKRERFLTADEFQRLGTALNAHKRKSPESVAIVQLLLLTGCRQSEIRTLEWTSYRAGNLYLYDSKTGPRTVWLSNPARIVLDSRSPVCKWIFPSTSQENCLPVESLYRCWRLIRREAGLEGLRLHDLRHSYASFALRSGESLLTIGRLLGHRDPSSTLRYTHFADELARVAVEKIGQALTH